MNEDTASAQAEGEVLPESLPPPLPDSATQRAEAAIEAWYADHFHAAAVAGRAPITAEDKASLIAHVTAAITPKE
ncbi:MAG TPA: hypothetical protein VF415_07230 [Rhodanobacter sp.]